MGSNIFLTGGAGFLGRAILERYSKEWPDCRFTVFSRDEAKHTRARRMFPQHNYILGDVRDTDRLETAILGHDIVIHAAAMKDVPRGETNVFESVAVNIDGSRNVAKAAMKAGIETVIGISSDKACQPVNVYGMTKLVMERIFQEADGLTDTKFNLVRYGNVIASTGSVVVVFRHQAKEGRITITDPAMTRFWLGNDEAVDLINLAIGEESGGTVLIPRLSSIDMRSVAVASAMLELGVRGSAEVQYDVIGQRFGEKLHEELVSPAEIVYTENTEYILGHKMPTEKEGVNKYLVMRMWPVTQGVREGHITHPYTSSNPDRLMTPDEFRQMVLEAPE